MGRSKRIKSISQPSIPSNPTLTQEQLQILRHAASIPNIPVSDLLSILKSFGASAPSSGLSSRPSPTEGSQHILGQIMDVNSCGLSSVSMNPPLSDPHNPLQDFNTIPGQVNGRNFDFTWLENAEIEDISSFWTENILPQISQLPNENFTDHQTPLLPSNYLSSPNSSQENAFTALHSHTGYLPESSLVPHTHHSRPDNDSQPQMYSSAEMCANDFYFAASQTQPQESSQNMIDQRDMPSSFASQHSDHFDQNLWEFIPAQNEAHLHGLEQNENPQQLTSTTVRRSTSNSSTGSASSSRKIRGPFKTAKARTETGMVRKIGSCIRCKFQRIRCVINEDDREGICQKCLVLSEPFSRVPCIRDKITDATVFLEMAAPDPRKTNRWKTMKPINITTWKSTDRRTVEWTQGVGTKACKLKVREFQPVDGDALDRTWTVAGSMKRKPCPTFAIEDMAAAAVNVIPWFDSSVVAYVKKGLNHDDRLIHSHYAFAYKISQDVAGDDGRQNERKLLRNVLRLWAAARTNTETDLLCGSELLGMKPDSDDPFSPYFERIPTPPVMAVQLQIILWCSILVPLKRQVLSQLQALILANKTQSWLTIYLCLFMFLHSCALITKGDYNYARKHAMKRMYAEPGVLEGLHHGATTMLAYFHYRNKGDLPFKFNSEKSDWVDLGGLDEEATRFTEYAFEEIRRRKSEIDGVREKKIYHDDLFFVSQMFDTDWKPVATEPFVAFEE